MKSDAGQIKFYEIPAKGLYSGNVNDVRPNCARVRADACVSTFKELQYLDIKWFDVKIG